MTAAAATSATTSAVRVVGVVVPARDEAAELPGCLASLALATSELRYAELAHGELGRGRPATEVLTVVVLDGCRDVSAEVVRRTGVVALELAVAGGVGAARRAGCALVLDTAAGWGVDVADVWLATTDADCRVPRDWLVEQLRHRAEGARAVVGTVDVADWSQRSELVARRWRTSYQPVDGHPHVHGANLGLDGAAYLAVGGFERLRLHEDVALVAALDQRFAVAQPGEPRVLTSGRRDARVRDGFGDTLSRDYHDRDEYPATA